jgi:hypothetical protein
MNRPRSGASHRYNGAAVPGCCFKTDIIALPGIDERGFASITYTIRVVIKAFGKNPVEQYAFLTFVGMYLPVVIKSGYKQA